jgi:predicted ABC-type transport system involved in lysophospholipase L1 biosynthesis ATPase subunit
MEKTDPRRQTAAGAQKTQRRRQENNNREKMKNDEMGAENQDRNGGASVRAAALSRSYGPATAQVHALRGASLEVGPGERVAILGKSGSGKSTLLNILAGLDRPTSGFVEVGGQDLGRLNPNQLAGFRQITVGMIFQSFNLVSTRSALQNVELPLVFRGVPRGVRRERATQSLEAVGLGHRLHHRPTQLSGGEAQRVAIARALVNRPRVLLADEPTGNLDSATAGEVLDLLCAHLAANRTTLLLVTHDAELARRAAERTVWMADGQVVNQAN